MDQFQRNNSNQDNVDPVSTLTVIYATTQLGIKEQLKIVIQVEVSYTCRYSLHKPRQN